MVNRKICYVIVVDVDNGNAVEKDDTVKAAPCDQSHSNSSFWYTRPTLQNLLQLLGCKVHHAFKISRRVFDTLEGENQHSAVKFKRKENLISNAAAFSSNMGKKCLEDDKTSISRPYKEKVPVTKSTDASYDSYDSYKTQATATVTRKRFLDVICSSLAEYRYVGPSQCADVMLACRIRERKESIIILLCGTSGCGKSTLSSLLASRLGITTVVSTDSIRHMMRSFADEKDNPLLWASTYHAGEFLDPSSVAKAKRKKRDRKLSKSLWKSQADTEVSARMVQSIDNTVDFPLLVTGNAITKYTAVDNFDKSDVPNLTSEQVGSKVLAIEGYKAQSEMVIESLDRLITAWEDRKDSVVVEGVHLSLNFVMGLMKKHPSIIPFLIYIGDEEKHMERFAIRAKYMTTDPSKNKYVKYIKNIRTIQDYLCKRADKHFVPKVNNTNVDRSVASIHSTIFSCLRRRQTGVPLYDVSSNTVKVINDEYRKHCDANSVSSKGMFWMIQRQGSLRRYVAIVNSDGSVAKAWPFLHSDKIREHSSSSADKDSIGNPIYGLVKVREAKPAYVQFGNFGLGSWPNGTEGTSTSSINGSRVDGDGDTTQVSSSSSLASHQEGHAKELIEEVAASETDEETLQDDEDEKDSGNSADDLVDDELGGSVVESSTRSDEEYETEEMDELLEDDSINLEAFGDTTTSFDGTHRLHKLSKSSSFAPMRRRPTREGMSQSSGPLQRHRSLKLKSVNTL